MTATSAVLSASTASPTAASPQPSSPGPRSTTSTTTSGGAPVSRSTTNSAAARVRERGLGLPTTAIVPMADSELHHPDRVLRVCPPPGTLDAGHECQREAPARWPATLLRDGVPRVTTRRLPPGSTQARTRSRAPARQEYRMTTAVLDTCSLPTSLAGERPL